MIASVTDAVVTKASATAGATADGAASAVASGTGEFFPVTYSGLSTQALVDTILPAYDLGEPVRCRLLNRGLTDTYEVKLAPAAHPEAADGVRPERVILRAYRAGW